MYQKLLNDFYQQYDSLKGNRLSYYAYLTI